ncbi:peptidase domain-containing ABC transporter [Vibrio atypicus]|uniref:peptidase domain-containing ABC transporter n=1 Tax=Vibrio atypicus TaxID=558271 RepID=UPI00135734ED|nr:peptidase domain-containing ABC transporter [Vibrio atypicus]
MINIIIATLFNKLNSSFIIIIVSACFSYAISLSIPLSFMAIIDRVLVSEGYATLNIILIALVVVAFIDGGLSLISSKINFWLNSVHIAEVSHHFFGKLFSLKKTEVDNTNVGEVLSRLGELDQIKNHISNWLSQFSLDLIFMVIFFVVIFNLNASLSLILLMTVPLHLLQYFIFNKKIKKSNEQMFSASIDYQNRMIESITAYDHLKANRKSDAILGRIYHAFDIKLRKGYELAKVNIYSGQLSELINKISEAVILFMGATYVLDQSMTLGALVAFNMMKDRVTGPLLRLASIWEEIIAFKISLERVNVIMEAESESSGEQLHRITSLSRGVQFHDVSFQYSQNELAVNQLSVEIRRGETLCILGESGAGKSTLAKLLAGDYDHYQGDILFDGIELKEIALPSLREQVAVVQQKSILLAGTIRENILFDSLSDDHAWVKRAGKLADIHDFIMSLPQGYDTPVAEQGGNFSGGQIQRIALARAFASDKPIMILDEATSALDYETEANIVANLAQLKTDKTIIIITHRLSLARISDAIIYMKNGEVLEQGNHESLINTTSHYRKLYQYQIGEVPSNSALPALESTG